MQTNDWEKRLATEVNHIINRTSGAVSRGNNNEGLRRTLTAEFLDRLGLELKVSIEKFNPSSPRKIEPIAKSKDRRGDQYCGIQFEERRIHFVDTGRGFLRVDLVDGDAVTEVAFLLARISRGGEFITWDEKNLLGFGNRLEPVTLKHIVRKYITFLVTQVTFK